MQPLSWKGHPAPPPWVSAVGGPSIYSKTEGLLRAIPSGSSNVSFFKSGWGETFVLGFDLLFHHSASVWMERLIKLTPLSWVFSSCCWSQPASLCSLKVFQQPLASSSLCGTSESNSSPSLSLAFPVSLLGQLQAESIPFTQWSLFYPWIPKMLLLVSWTSPSLRLASLFLHILCAAWLFFCRILHT